MIRAMKRSASRVLTSLAALALSAMAAPSGAQLPPAVRRATQACVEVLVDGRLEASGWFADAEGHVVTAGHAARQTNSEYEIVWPGHGRYPASFVAIDPGHDIALLRAAVTNPPVPFLRVAPEIPPAGTKVHFYGTAQFKHGILFSGEVSRSDPTLNIYPHLRWPMRCYFIAAPSPPGVSGGAWLDAKGRVAGNQSGFINQGESASSGMAIIAPPDAIARLVATRASVRVPSMGCGFEELWTQPAGFIRRLPKGLEGIVTVPLDADGPAGKAGLTKESVITMLGGRRVRYLDDIVALLHEKKPGDTLDVEAWDPEAKAPRAVTLTLGEAKP
jgi:S1-C subfamily serine protease